jgi:hypothetical protein
MHEAGGIRKGGKSRTSHGQTKRMRRMVRTTIPWDCRIANLQRLKRNYLKKNKNKNTQEGKCTFRSTKLKRSRRGQSELTPLVAAYAHPDTQSRTSHGRSLSLSNEGGEREMKKQRLYIRVKGMKVPKNKREGIDTCGQSISDRNAWNAPPSSLQILLVQTSKISTTRVKMLPPAHPPADLHGKSMEKAANTAQKRGQPKGQPKQPSCKEEADQLAKLVGSNAWAKKKKKAELKKARKQMCRL